jgi:hypothetical protein
VIMSLRQLSQQRPPSRRRPNLASNRLANIRLPNEIHFDTSCEGNRRVRILPTSRLV